MSMLNIREGTPTKQRDHIFENIGETSEHC